MVWYIPYLVAIVYALIGGVAYILFKIYNGELEKTKGQVIARVFLSIIAGIVYFESGLPNHLGTIVVGWFAPSFLTQIFKATKNWTK